MEVSIERHGPSLDALVERKQRELRAASRKVGNAVKKSGMAAVRKATPRRFAGRALRVKGRVRPGPTRVDVEIYGTPAGYWTILESGAQAHMIKPRRGKALHWGGDVFSAGHQHPGAAGQGVWTRAQPAVEAAVEDAVTDIYDRVVTRG